MSISFPWWCRRMKVSRAQAEENRNRIVDMASELFREHGFDGVGVADLMKAAGLTHGGFYGNFKSKEELAAKASERALSKNIARLSTVIGDAKDDPLAALVTSYLSERHIEERGDGCAFSA